ncbi:MAG TPA: Ig-like domain-containing protein, partial [Flavisolibacter sp.]|nr:Ig-like domain-containing protein [Flavisolibacter sp.]
ITVRIKPTVDLSASERNRVVIKNTFGSRTYVQKAQWQNGWLAAKFRQFGKFQAFIDEQPPTINNISPDLSRASRIVFTPRDNFNTIKNFRVELNGKWLRFTNDKGKTWIYTFDERFPRGEHQLRVIVEDEAGNVTDKVWTVRK